MNDIPAFFSQADVFHMIRSILRILVDEFLKYELLRRGNFQGINYFKDKTEDFPNFHLKINLKITQVITHEFK